LNFIDFLNFSNFLQFSHLPLTVVLLNFLWISFCISCLGVLGKEEYTFNPTRCVVISYCQFNLHCLQHSFAEFFLEFHPAFIIKVYLVRNNKMSTKYIYINFLRTNSYTNFCLIYNHMVDFIARNINQEVIKINHQGKTLPLNRIKCQSNSNENSETLLLCKNYLIWDSPGRPEVLRVSRMSRQLSFAASLVVASLDLVAKMSWKPV